MREAIVGKYQQHFVQGLALRLVQRASVCQTKGQLLAVDVQARDGEPEVDPGDKV